MDARVEVLVHALEAQALRATVPLEMMAKTLMRWNVERESKQVRDDHEQRRDLVEALVPILDQIEA